MENFKGFSRILLIFSILHAMLWGGSVSANGKSFHFVAPYIPSPTSVVILPTVSDYPPVDTNKRKGKNKSPQPKNKKVTFETYEENYKKAMQFYNNHLYISAARLFEELYPLSLGTPRADTVLFLFADCYYNNEDYEMAAFHFKEYAGKYSSSPRAEDAHYKAILALSNISPEYSLDQTETYYVIEEIQLFIRTYPASSHMEECNELLDKMRNKLARKEFEVLSLYYNTENYKSAQIIARNFFKDYSYSEYCDDAYALLVKNNYEYARHSVDSKKVERYSQCVEAYQNMRIYCPTSDLLKEAGKYAEEAQNIIDKKEFKKSKKKEKKHED